MKGFHLKILSGEFSVWRLPPDAPLPPLDFSSFLSMTRTDDELSIVSSTIDVPAGARAEAGWRCLKVEGPLAFEMTGVLARLSAPLARAEIPVFIVSTYDTDYILVKDSDLDRACSALDSESHVIARSTQVKS